MSRQRRIILVVIVAILAAGFAAYWSFREPRHNGKSLSQWLAVLDHSSDWEALEPDELEAEQAIREISPKAVPYLVKMFGYQESRPREAIREWLANRLDSNELRYRPMTLRDRGFKGFIALGELGEAALPEIQRIIEGPRMAAEYNNEPMQVLVLLGTNGVKECLAYLSETNSFSIRVRTLNALAKVADSENPRIRSYFQSAVAPKVIPLVIRLLEDEDVDMFAAMSLGSMKSDSAQVIPALQKVLADQSKSELLRFSAASAIEDFGSAAKSAIPLLQRIAKEEVGKLGERCEEALKVITE